MEVLDYYFFLKNDLSIFPFMYYFAKIKNKMVMNVVKEINNNKEKP